MFSHLVRRCTIHASSYGSSKAPIGLLSPSCHQPTRSRVTTIRSFASSLPPDDPQGSFVARPPPKLNMEMARGIQEGNKLILRHGVGQQRLQLLATQSGLPLVTKWQRMMEIYLGAQLHVIAALGYETNEQGIMMYTQQLSQFVQGCDYDTQEEFRAMGRDTWRNMLATAFSLDTSELKDEMSIVDARNTVHKVASKLMEPSILEMVAQTCAKLPPRKYQRFMTVLFGVVVEEHTHTPRYPR